MAATQALMDAALAKAKAARDADLADLMEELRIPSVSAVPAHRDDCIRNARWLQARMEALGIDTKLVDVVDGGLPLVVGDWNGDGRTKAAAFYAGVWLFDLSGSGTTIVSSTLGPTYGLPLAGRWQ